MSWNKKFTGSRFIFFSTFNIFETNWKKKCLQSEYSRQKEEFQVLQADCYVQIAQLNAQLKKLTEEKSDLERQKATRDAKISTLTKDWRERETKFENEKNELEKRITLLEQAKKEIQRMYMILIRLFIFHTTFLRKPQNNTKSTSRGKYCTHRFIK
jgi:peptidoglycan hydrolase CwlO-like protein